MSHHLKTEKRDLNELVFDGRRIIVVHLPFGYIAFCLRQYYDIQVTFNHEFLNHMSNKRKLRFIYARTLCRNPTAL